MAASKAKGQTTKTMAGKAAPARKATTKKKAGGK